MLRYALQYVPGPWLIQLVVHIWRSPATWAIGTTCSPNYVRCNTYTHMPTPSLMPSNTNAGTHDAKRTHARTHTSIQACTMHTHNVLQTATHRMTAASLDNFCKYQIQLHSIWNWMANESSAILGLTLQSTGVDMKVPNLNAHLVSDLTWSPALLSITKPCTVLVNLLYWVVGDNAHLHTHYCIGLPLLVLLYG